MKDLIAAYKLYKKVKKAYKASKILIDNKQGLAKETQDALIELRLAAQKLVQLLPEYKEVDLEIKAIIEKCFKK